MGTSDQVIRTSAIVIRTADFGEADRMLTLLTKDRGLLSAKVKAAKKQTSKLFCASSMFCCGEYEFYEKGGYYGIRGCGITHSFQKLPEDYDAYSAACVIADVAEKAAQQDLKEPKLFALVVNALYALETKAAPRDTVLCYFLQRLLYIEGLYPSPDSCVSCGSPKATRFSAERGGFVCETCANGAARVGRDVLDALRSMEGIVPKEIAKVKIPENTRGKLKDILIALTENALQKRLKTARFVTKHID